MAPTLLSQDTIAAIASGLTQSGIRIIRISGPEAFGVADRVCRLKCGRPVSEAGSHVIRYGVVVDGSETVIDEALFMIMKGPGTYTGEDTVEINCHGGLTVMRRILRIVLDNGARAAEPGEFTKRAFLNGRIDLSEAEAVMDVIDAKSDAAIKSAVRVLRGSVRHEVETIRSLLLTHLARIEAAIDDPEHLGFDEDDLTESEYTDDYLKPERMKSSSYRGTLQRDVDEARQKLAAMLERYDEGRYIREGIRTVILGKPNAGKSSLLNRLLGEDRAIVTEIPGTTRDTLEETATIGGLTLLLTDTAGIRETDEPVEKIGVERAKKAASEADLILFVADASEPLDENDREILAFLRERGETAGGRLILLLNKADRVEEDKRLKEAKDQLLGQLSLEGNIPVIVFSATEGLGQEELGCVIGELFMSGKAVFSEEVTIANERQRQAIIEALDALDMVRQSLRDKMPEDFYAIDLMGAYAALGRVIGAEVGEDVINEVFARFCMGK